MSIGRSSLSGLLTAVGISTLGTRMSAVALPWFVLVTTGSTARTGLVAFAALAPYVLAQALTGPLVDRLGPWRVSVTSDLLAAVAVACIPAAHAADALTLQLLIVLAAFAGVLRGAGDTARDVLLPGVRDHAGVSTERAAGLYDGVSRLAGLIGAPTAGVLIAATSALSVLGVDAATFAISSAVVALRVPRSTAVAARPGPALSYARSIHEGFAFLRRDRVLLGIAAMVAVTNFIDAAGSGVLLPAWAHDIQHSSVSLGLLGLCFGSGAVIGNAVTTWVGHRLPRRASYGVGFLAAGAPRYVALALASTLPPVLPVLVFAGLGAGGINPIVGAVEYERVPAPLQARVLGAVGASAWIGMPFGALTAGALVSGVGLRATLMLAALIYGTTTLAPFIFPAWQNMNRKPVLTPAGHQAHR